MPLHDWSDDAGWDGLHLLWIGDLLHWIKQRLPEPYRVYAGSAAGLSISGKERPDVAVRQWQPEPAPITDASPAGMSASTGSPFVEELAVLTLEPEQALYIAYHGKLIAGIELISPRNKDRPSAREHYLARYLGYLRAGAHLLLIDVHPRPTGFSFADSMAQELQISQPRAPAPMAVCYRVGEPAATGGRMIGIWRRPLTVGELLPTAPLPLTMHMALDVDLETTYMQAAADAYL